MVESLYPLIIKHSHIAMGNPPFIDDVPIKHGYHPSLPEGNAKIIHTLLLLWLPLQCPSFTVSLFRGRYHFAKAKLRYPVGFEAGWINLIPSTAKYKTHQPDPRNGLYKVFTNHLAHPTFVKGLVYQVFWGFGTSRNIPLNRHLIAAYIP